MDAIMYSKRNKQQTNNQSMVLKMSATAVLVM